LLQSVASGVASVNQTVTFNQPPGLSGTEVSTQGKPGPTPVKKDAGEGPATKRKPAAKKEAAAKKEPAVPKEASVRAVPAVAKPSTKQWAIKTGWQVRDGRVGPGGPALGEQHSLDDDDDVGDQHYYSDEHDQDTRYDYESPYY